VARIRLEWSADALADLDRFAAFLSEQHPRLAPIVAAAIIERADLLVEFPELGRPDKGRHEYRQVVLRVLNARYVFQ
jgi:plasmid stabilization system protein ParE